MGKKERSDGKKKKNLTFDNLGPRTKIVGTSNLKSEGKPAMGGPERAKKKMGDLKKEDKSYLTREVSKKKKKKDDCRR